MAKRLVRLWERPSYDGRRFRYYLLYTDEQGRRRQKSLGHADRRKAERQRAQFKRKLTMGIVEPGSMKLRDFVEDSLRRTDDQIRESTHKEYCSAMEDFIRVVGDIDYRRVSPKGNTAETWEWLIKDTDCRTLPLTDGLTQFLVDHQSRQPEGHPYVFVPPARYDYIQHELRVKGKWTYSDSRLKVVNNSCPDFRKILKRAGIEGGEFHDLRRTAICNWFKEGMREYDVMKLAGHADFKTTHKYYLRVHDDLVDRARQATARGLCRTLLQNCCSGNFSPQAGKTVKRKCLVVNVL